MFSLTHVAAVRQLLPNRNMTLQVIPVTSRFGFNKPQFEGIAGTD